MSSTFSATIVTTTYAKGSKPWEVVRANCALKTLEAAALYGYRVICVDGGSPNSYIQQMKQFGASVFTQQLSGMGNARREAFQHAMAVNSQAVIWLEPEKYPMIPLLDGGIKAIEQRGSDLALFRRLSLASYPPEQAMAYRMCGLAFQYLFGFDCDYGYGPVGFSRRVVEDYVLPYAGDYGDLWDSVHIPKLRAIHDGLKYEIIDVDYRHPAEQTAAETGVELFMKRVEQISSICDAVFRETARLRTQP